MKEQVAGALLRIKLEGTLGIMMDYPTKEQRELYEEMKKDPEALAAFEMQILEGLMEGEITVSDIFVTDEEKLAWFSAYTPDDDDTPLIHYLWGDICGRIESGAIVVPHEMQEKVNDIILAWHLDTRSALES
jgi:hypothetical protein